MSRPDSEWLDGLMKILIQAPRTQIDEDIVTDIKKFMSEEHTRDEKYDFIQNIAKEPLNMIGDNVGVGRITPFVAMVCNLDAAFGEPNEPIVSQSLEPKEGEHVAYGWDGKPFIAKDESNESKITVQYLVDNQGEDKEEDVLVDIFSYMDDLMSEGKFNVVDDFIKEFCEHEICFQYCLCLLTCANWAKNNIKNKQMLIDKTIAQGTKEMGEEDTINCLHGLI